MLTSNVNEYTLNKIVKYQSVDSNDISNEYIHENNNSIEYIFDLKYNSDYSRLFSLTSDSYISSYDPITLQRNICFHTHDNKVNAFHISNYSNDIILTCSDDKSTKIWDIRTSLPCYNINSPEEVNDVALGLGGWLLAVGHSNSISFYDVRMQSNNNNNRLGIYDDVHTDMITQLQFLNGKDSILLSAAEDCLITVYDTSVSANEDAVLSILNTESPIRKFGLFGNDMEGLYALSTIETLSIWHYPSAQRINNFDRIRDDFCLDYLVDCIYNPSNDSLRLLGGNYSGSARILNIQPSCVNQICDLYQSHSEAIRSLASNSITNTIITGGEDSMICSWNGLNSSNNNSNISRSVNEIKSKAVKMKKSLRHRPY